LAVLEEPLEGLVGLSCVAFVAGYFGQRVKDLIEVLVVKDVGAGVCAVTASYARDFAGAFTHKGQGVPVKC